MIGFSTGALAKGNLVKAFQMAKELDCQAIEVSALRETELFLAIELLPQFQKHFSYVSFHAPSKLEFFSEEEVVSLLKRVKVPLVVHPDIIKNFILWDELDNLLIENMDHRKTIGQTSKDLNSIFEQFPSSQKTENELIPKQKFCLDLAHALYLDPSALLIKDLIYNFKSILTEVHISEIDQDGQHKPISITTYRKLRYLKDKYGHGLIPKVPFIIESVCKDPKEELEIAKEIYDVATS